MLTSGAGPLYGGCHVLFTVAQSGLTKLSLVIKVSMTTEAATGSLSCLEVGMGVEGAFSCNMTLHH